MRYWDAGLAPFLRVGPGFPNLKRYSVRGGVPGHPGIF